jgi:lipopolysaccharide export system permease protein
MRILDRYLLKTFVMPWLTCVIGFSFLFVIVDLVESLEAFVEGGVSLLQILLYYARFLPSIWVYIGPITLLLGLLYTLYHLTRNNEVIAMRASGISIYRILLPFMVLGILISLFSLHISRNVAPRTLAWTQDFQQHVSRQGESGNVISQIRFREPDHNRTWDIEQLNPDSGEISGVTVLQRRPNNNFEYTLTAESAFWQDESWFFRNAVLQQHSEEGYRMGLPEQRDLLPMPAYTESPARMIRENKTFQVLTSSEIRSYLTDRKRVSPQTRAQLMTEIFMRQGHPWLCLVTMLMAVPFGTQTARKGVFLGVALCLLLFFSLFFSMNLFKAMGLGQKISPWLAGWGPTLLFGGLGIGLLRKLR